MEKERFFETTKGIARLVQQEQDGKYWLDVYLGDQYIGIAECTLEDCDEYIDEQVEELLSEKEDYIIDDNLKEFLAHRNKELHRYRPELTLVVNTDEDGFYIDIKKGDKNTLFTNCIESVEDLESELYDACYTLIKAYYVVSYVGLSDNEQDADGYNQTKLFNEIESAENYVDKLCEQEMETQKDSNPKHSVDDDGKHIISWAGDSEKVIIEIHKEYLNYL